MAILTYLDASGTKEHPSLSVAGFIATEERWIAFDHAWVAALAEFGITDLHMKDFVSSRRQFDGWDKDEPKRRRFVQRITSVINTNTDKSVGAILFVADYDEVNTVLAVRESLGAPYTATALYALTLAKTWIERHHSGEAMAFFVERGDTDQGELFNILRRVGFIQPVTPLDKRTVVNGVTTWVHPFQACDFIAYEMAKHAKVASALGVDSVRARQSLLQIAPRERDDMWRFMNGEILREVCAAAKIPRRHRA